MGEEETFFSSSRFLQLAQSTRDRWTRESNHSSLHVYIWEPHIREGVRDPTHRRDSETERSNEVYITSQPRTKVRCLGTWREGCGKEGRLQDNKKSRCLVMRCLPCPTDRSSELFLVFILIVDKARNLNSPQGDKEGAGVFAGFQSPSAQNNPYAEAAQLRETCLTPFT